MKITQEDRDTVQACRDKGMGAVEIYEAGILPGRTRNSIKNIMFPPDGYCTGTRSIDTAIHRTQEMLAGNGRDFWLTEYGCLLRQDVPIRERHKMFREVHK